MYLRFVISVEALKMDPKKVNEILQWPTVENVGEVGSFYGFARFYRKFIKHFSSVSNPMTGTMRGDQKNIRWIYGVDQSFQLLKKKVVQHPVLALLDFN